MVHWRLPLNAHSRTPPPPPVAALHFAKPCLQHYLPHLAPTPVHLHMHHCSFSATATGAAHTACHSPPLPCSPPYLGLATACHFCLPATTCQASTIFAAFLPGLPRARGVAPPRYDTPQRGLRLHYAGTD